MDIFSDTLVNFYVLEGKYIYFLTLFNNAPKRWGGRHKYLEASLTKNGAWFVFLI